MAFGNLLGISKKIAGPFPKTKVQKGVGHIICYHYENNLSSAKCKSCKKSLDGFEKVT